MKPKALTNTVKKSRTKKVKARKEIQLLSTTLVDWKGGTYSKLFSLFKATHVLAPETTHTIPHHSKPFKKAKRQELDKVESNPKIRPDPTSKR